MYICIFHIEKKTFLVVIHSHLDASLYFILLLTTGKYLIANRDYVNVLYSDFP